MANQNRNPPNEYEITDDPSLEAQEPTVAVNTADQSESQAHTVSFPDAPTSRPAKAGAAGGAGDDEPEREVEQVKVKATRQPWRQRFSLSGMILWTVLFSILSAGGAAGYYALSVLYSSKLNDTWAILYLELENKGSQLVQRLEQFTSMRPGEGSAIPKRAPDHIFHIVSSEKLAKISGSLPETMKLTDLRLSSSELKERFNILQFAGQNFLALDMRDALVSQILGSQVPQGRFLVMWKLDIDAWFADSTDDPEKNTIYLISKEGRILFSNDPDITEKTYINRPLVQKFVAAPLRSGQLEFEAPDGPAYGFFYEVPNTNLMMFVETSKKVALASVRETAVQYGIVLIMILAFVGILLQFPLSTLTAPMRELVRMAWEVGEGNFNIQPSAQGFGELNVLNRAFVDMGQNLIAREERIQLLLVEQQEKFRLADELAIAHSIQNNFLFNAPLPKDSGLEVATHYTPAAEVAGDWYGYFYDELNGESVFAVADVSGHGAGSAMFTAIIAALFEETRASGISFPIDDFARRLNRLILKLGHGEMHATLLIAKYRKGSGELEILNAGHPFPLLVYPEESGTKNEPVAVRSDYLGSGDTYEPACGIIPFAPGTSLLMYTDGLIEGRADHKLYSERRLSKTCKVGLHHSMNQLVTKIYEDWRKYLDGEPALDDVCLMAVRATP